MPDSNSHQPLPSWPIIRADGSWSSTFGEPQGPHRCLKATHPLHAYFKLFNMYSQVFPHLRLEWHCLSFVTQPYSSKFQHGTAYLMADCVLLFLYDWLCRHVLNWHLWYTLLSARKLGSQPGNVSLSFHRCDKIWAGVLLLKVEGLLGSCEFRTPRVTNQQPQTFSKDSIYFWNMKH